MSKPIPIVNLGCKDSDMSEVVDSSIECTGPDGSNCLDVLTDKSRKTGLWMARNEHVKFSSGEKDLDSGAC